MCITEDRDFVELKVKERGTLRRRIGMTVGQEKLHDVRLAMITSRPKDCERLMWIPMRRALRTDCAAMNVLEVKSLDQRREVDNAVSRQKEETWDTTHCMLFMLDDSTEDRAGGTSPSIDARKISRRTSDGRVRIGCKMIFVFRVHSWTRARCACRISSVARVRSIRFSRKDIYAVPEASCE